MKINSAKIKLSLKTITIDLELNIRNTDKIQYKNVGLIKIDDSTVGSSFKLKN